MASEDRPWFHEHGRGGELYKEYSKFSNMSQRELFEHVRKNYGGDFSSFKADYNNVVNSHWRYGPQGGKKRDGENPFDSRPDLKIDVNAIEQEWNYAKGADTMLKPLESILGQRVKDFIQDGTPLKNRFSAVLSGLVGGETLNVNKGGFKPVEEFSIDKKDPKTGEVTKTRPIQEYKKTLKEKASGITTVDTGGTARGILASLARKGVSGVSADSAAQSSMSKMASQASASNARQQVINNISYKDEARAGLTSLTSDLIKFNTERKKDLQADLGETIVGMANLTAANSGYEELRTLNNQPFSHFGRKKD